MQILLLQSQKRHTNLLNAQDLAVYDYEEVETEMTILKIYSIYSVTEIILRVVSNLYLEGYDPLFR